MTMEGVGAVATSLGVLVALAFGVVAERRAVSDRRAQEETHRRAQASQVSAWIAAQPAGEQLDRAVIVVQNASNQPVWSVMVEYFEVNNAEDGWDECPASWRLGVLPPGAERSLEAPWTPPARDEPVGVSFRDNANNWWLRREGGYLLPLSNDPSTV